jgi:glycerol-3-phosphate dehydrogenase (NAD(P)+)
MPTSASERGGAPSRASPFRRVVVVGDGGWGTTLARILVANGCERVGLWSHDADYAEHLARTRTNPRYLPGFDLPPALHVASDFDSLLDGADLLVSAVPTTFLRSTWTEHARRLPADVPLVSVSKGLEDETLLRPSQVLTEVAGGGRPLCVLSGPNIAREIARGLPAATVVGTPDAGLAHRVQATFSNEAFRVYSNPDLAGVELGGVLKNVIAVAAGLCDGMGLGDNAKAALVSRGMVEIARLGEALGGRRPTFFGLSGLGDLLTTCMSPSSRNRTFGERVGRGERIEDILASTPQVAEGVKTARPLHRWMHAHELVLPISEEVYRLLHENRSPRDMLRSLMTRARKDEAEDLRF